MFYLNFYGETIMTTNELKWVLVAILSSILDHDPDAQEEAEEWLLESVESISTFNNAGVMSSNPGLRFQLRDGNHLHVEITH